MVNQSDLQVMKLKLAEIELNKKIQANLPEVTTVGAIFDCDMKMVYANRTWEKSGVNIEQPINDHVNETVLSLLNKRLMGMIWAVEELVISNHTFNLVVGQTNP